MLAIESDLRDGRQGRRFRAVVASSRRARRLRLDASSHRGERAYRQQDLHNRKWEEQMHCKEDHPGDAQRLNRTMGKREVE